LLLPEEPLIRSHCPLLLPLPLLLLLPLPLRLPSATVCVSAVAVVVACEKLMDMCSGHSQQQAECVSCSLEEEERES